jgi:2-methylcitrate dehydratase
MIAVPLIFGDLIAEHYEDDFHAANPLIDQLRDKMAINEDERYSQEYLQSDKRSIANAIQVFFSDGTSTEKVAVEYPIGHRRRREEGIPVLEKKFVSNLQTRFPKGTAEKIFALCSDQQTLEETPVHEFMDLFSIN